MTAPDTPSARTRDRLVRTLGWASAAFGLPVLLAPGPVSEALGLGDGEEQRLTARLVGARELAAAAGLLTTGSPFWLWVRVGGDAMDLALLRRGLDTARSKDRDRLLAVTGVVAGLVALDVYAAATRSRRRTPYALTASTTIAKPPAEVAAFWRQLDNLPTFMAHLDRVEVTSRRTSTWTASAPFGKVSWDATITEDVPGERLSWRSEPGATIANSGTVHFRPAPGDRGTELRVELSYEIPGGGLGKAVARYFGEEPHQQLDDDLRRLKQVLETGEVVRSEGAPGGKRARREFPQHAAQPLTRKELAKEARS